MTKTIADPAKFRIHSSMIFVSLNKTLYESDIIE